MIATSYRLSPETSTLWQTPDGPVQLTVHVFTATSAGYQIRCLFALANLISCERAKRVEPTAGSLGPLTGCPLNTRIERS
jgi:hypothetical protein